MPHFPIPQNPVLIIHYHEIALKRGNQKYFEVILKRNIQRRLGGFPSAQVRSVRNRLLVRGLTPADMPVVLSRLRKIFGIAHISIGAEVKATMPAMQKAAQTLVQGLHFDSFAVRAKRAEKHYPFTSVDMGREIGSAVWEVSHAAVDLRDPELEVFAEVVQEQAYLFAARVLGPGGLPTSASGRAVVLFSAGFDAPVAAWRMMKRGLTLHLVHFHAQPFTNDASVRKARALAQVLAQWHGRMRLTFISFAPAQKTIAITTPERFRTILYRRMMLRVADRMAWRKRSRALITGESLGQVASQTLANMSAIQEAATFPVLRPLIGMDKQEILDEAQKIGTYDISILPHEESCTLFMPRRVETAAKLDEVHAAESGLDIRPMVDALIATAETEIIYPDWWVDGVSNRQ